MVLEWRNGPVLLVGPFHTPSRPPPLLTTHLRDPAAGVHDKRRREARCPHAKGESTLGCCAACTSRIFCRYSLDYRERSFFYFRSTRSKKNLRLWYYFKLYSLWGEPSSFFRTAPPSPLLVVPHYPLEATIRASEHKVPKPAPQ